MSKSNQIKGIVVTFVLVLINFLSKGSFWVDSFCLNIVLLQKMEWLEVRSPGLLGQLCETSNVSRNGRLVWLNGYMLWIADLKKQAQSQWQLAPDHTIRMLLHQAQTGKLNQTEINEIFKMILLLDTQSDEASGVATSQLMQQNQWTTSYQILAQVHNQNPHNAVVQAALALSSSYNSSEYDPFALLDGALDKAPNNPYVLLYGVRLMLRSHNFGLERTRRVVLLGEKQLPQGFTFTYGIATAFRRLGDYAAANRYNLDALSLLPNHALANLQQAELSQLLGEPDIQNRWLNEALGLRVSSLSYSQRLISVLANAGRISDARTVFCEGMSYGISPITLIELVADDLKGLFTSNVCQDISQ